MARLSHKARKMRMVKVVSLPGTFLFSRQADGRSRVKVFLVVDGVRLSRVEALLEVEGRWTF